MFSAVIGDLLSHCEDSPKKIIKTAMDEQVDSLPME
jgi:hypothetical protein